MRRVIVNSTPIILLSNINQLELLKQLYETITIPQAVYDEVTAKPDSACQNLKNHFDWIKVEKTRNPIQKKMYEAKLHDGEVEVMILAQEEPKADLVILDDNSAKKTAKFLELSVTGTLGVLVKAKQLNYIEKVKPLMDALIANGFFVTQNVYSMVLEQTGE
ncbi:MAG: DUF3368 domain-containing protein [Treponema sp.]|nr:DUF3368 domain-containing protein [Treponema sp.]